MKECTLIKVDRNGTQYFQSNVCRKCGGEGYLYGYEHIDGARCWKCQTTGREKPYQWKVYTDEYAAKLDDRRRAKMMSKVPELNQELFKRWGFNENGKTYVVIGNTFEIKDSLKSARAKYNDYFGWHFANPNPSFVCCEVDISEVADKDDLGVWQMRYYNEVFEIVKKKKEQSAPKTESEYIGTVGEKISVYVTLVSIHTYETHFTYYGETNHIFKFADENGNTVVWKTASWQNLTEGEKYSIEGKVKEHSEYKGDKQTALTRCKISKQEA